MKRTRYAEPSRTYLGAHGQPAVQLLLGHSLTSWNVLYFVTVFAPRDELYTEYIHMPYSEVCKTKPNSGVKSKA